jgi:hypothetical protein
MCRSQVGCWNPAHSGVLPAVDLLFIVVSLIILYAIVL